MKLNRNDLRKILYDFNSYACRLLQANYQDYTGVLKKFLKFIDENPLISEYINSCGCCDWNLAESVQAVQEAHGTMIFELGDTEEEEVRNIYAVLQYLAGNDNPIYCGVARGYSSSKSWQDKVKGFNDRFVMVLINHVERYLTKVGIDMGLDEKNVYTVTVHHGNSYIANDNSNITTTTYIGGNASELKELIAGVRAVADTLPSPEDKEAVSESLDVIENEAFSEKPKKSMIKTAVASLKAVKGVAELGAAVAALIEFIRPML